MKIRPIKLNNEKVKELRELKGWSLTEFAELIHVSKPHMSNIERGFKQPSIECLGRIASALSVRIDYIVVYYDKMGFERPVI